MATPKYENILRFRDRSFMIRHDRIHFSDEAGYHVHPEMELALLVGGGGVRTVNGIDERFGATDIVFIPGDIPHCWTFEAGMCPSDGIITDMSCQFPKTLLHNIGQVMPEFKAAAAFFTSLNQAIQITGDTARAVRTEFERMEASSPPVQALGVMKIFNIIYERHEFRMVGMPLPSNSSDCRDSTRFHMVDRFIAENFAGKISLREVAATVGMSPTAFCNAFKAMSGTTFNRYLTSYRMQTAASMLRDTELNISEIGYKVGYGDLPHFTRAFTAHFGLSPTAYRRKDKNSD